MIPLGWENYFADEDDYIDAHLEYMKPEYYEDEEETERWLRWR